MFMSCFTRFSHLLRSTKNMLFGGLAAVNCTKCLHDPLQGGSSILGLSLTLARKQELLNMNDWIHVTYMTGHNLSRLLQYYLDDDLFYIWQCFWIMQILQIPKVDACKSKSKFLHWCPSCALCPGDCQLYIEKGCYRSEFIHFIDSYSFWANRVHMDFRCSSQA